MLESKNFIATDDDVAKIAQAIVAADGEADNGRKSYLRSLIATTQRDLGVEPRMRNGKSSKLEPEETEKQLAALSLVHERFYAIILKVTSEAVTGGPRGRSIEINRLTNFARTALYAVRTWMKAGNDITTLAPAKATKASLAVTLRKTSRPTAKVLLNRSELYTESLLIAVKQLAQADKAMAIEQMQSAVRSLTEQLVKLGVASPRKIAPALKMLLRPVVLASNGNGAHAARSTTLN